MGERFLFRVFLFFLALLNLFDAALTYLGFAFYQDLSPRETGLLGAWLYAHYGLDVMIAVKIISVVFGAVVVDRFFGLTSKIDSNWLRRLCFGLYWLVVTFLIFFYFYVVLHNAWEIRKGLS